MRLLLQSHLLMEQKVTIFPKTRNLPAQCFRSAQQTWPLIDCNFVLLHLIMANVNQFNNCSTWNWSFKINFVARNGHHSHSAEAGCCNKSYFIHHVHGCSAKQCIIVIGCVGENRFKNMRFRIFNSLF